MAVAVNELQQPVYGSISLPPTSRDAWINHYHHKSEEEYFAKAARRSVLDKVGIAYNNRTAARSCESEKHANDVYDDAAWLYYLANTDTRVSTSPNAVRPLYSLPFCRAR
jgi:hypothetical protein